MGEFRMWMIHEVVRPRYFITERIEDRAFLTLHQGIAKFLLSRLDSSSVVRASHQQIADWLGTHRETVSYTIREFRSKKILLPGYRKITVLDRQGLVSESEKGRPKHY